MVKIREAKIAIKKQIYKLVEEDKKMKGNVKAKTYLCPLADCEGCREDCNAASRFLRCKNSAHTCVPVGM